MHDTQLNQLMSFDAPANYALMTEKEKLELKSDVKKQAAYYMLSVSRAVEAKDYKTAKAILIYIADSCSILENPDREVHYLMEVCCLHLAVIKKKEDEEKEEGQLKKDVTQHISDKKEVYVMKYNKFSGEFECDESNPATINQRVLFYLSKLNAILFSYQNMETNNSMTAMLGIYGGAFIIVLILIVLLVLTVSTSFIEGIMSAENSQLYGELPIYIIGLLFIIPILIIYFKEPLKKDSKFFQIKLGEEIIKINQQCLNNQENIRFCMPEGLEINVHVKEADNDQSST